MKTTIIPRWTTLLLFGAALVLQDSAPGQSANPGLTVSLVNPISGARYSSPATITLIAELSNPNALVSRVEFYANGSRLGEDTDSPFKFPWQNVTDGSYSLAAKAFVSNFEVASSAPVNITVGPAPLPPSIVSHPQDRLAPAGATVSFEALVDGTPPFAYQWFFDQSALTGATNAALELSNVQTNQTGQYFAVIANDAAFVTSRVARLTVAGALGELKWSFATGGPIRSSPAIGTDGTVYFGSSDQNFYALNPDGTKKWSFAAGDVVHSSPALASDGTIYFGTGDFSAGDVTTPGTLYALRPDGSKRWEFITPLGIVSSPAIAADGSVYFGSYDAKLYALRPDGAKQWEFAAGDAIYSSPIVAINREIYFGSFDGKLRALSPDGVERWHFDTGGTIQSSPALGSDGTIYFGSNDKKFYALNPDGSKKWEFAAGNVIASSPAVATDGTIYFGASDKKFYALNPDGSKKWEFAAGSLIFSSPAIASDGTIYFGSHDKKLHALGSDGLERWQFTTGSGILSSPNVSAAGDVYVGSFDAQLYALRGFGGPAQSPWPMFRRDAAHTGNLSRSNQSPNVAIASPTNQSHFIAPAAVVFAARANDPDGRVALVEFYLNNTKLGEATNAPYEISLTNLTAGTYALTAAATDDLSARAISPLVTFDVADPVLPPTITLQPLSQNAFVGTSVDLVTAASGSRPLGYQWFFNGQAIAGATNSTLRLNAVYATDIGAYFTVVTNSAGSVTSLVAQITLRTAAVSAWNFQAGAGIRSSPAVAVDGTVYFGGMDNKVYALNSDGTKRWEFDTGDAVEASPAIATDGTIYIGSWSDRLFALAPDGTKRWEFVTGDDVVGSAAIGPDGVIYFGSVDHNLYALNPDGTKRWEFAAGAGIYSSPSLGTDGTIYFGANDNQLHALAPDGSPRWEFTTGGVIDSTPAIGGDGAIYFGSHDKKLYALNPDGTPRWSFATGGEVISSPAIGADGAIYFGSYDRRLYALNADGSKRWDFPAADVIYASPLLGADGAIYLGNLGNRFYTLNADGSARASFALGSGVESSAVMSADGLVIFGSGDGTLRAFVSKDSPALAAWPMFRHDARHTALAATTSAPLAKPPTFLPPRLLANNALELTLVGSANVNYGISASTNLTDWVALTNVASSDGTNRYREPLTLKFSQRYYRAQVR